ncbi:MAG: aminodeoxychorismate/anthranilate synthase component II [Myxococcales bacterium]|nr:aminodeoxychorismate/anthranilate synthase component II [Myxococcales bacterium]
MLLLIDNYDSFTYNLVQYFGELGQEVRVVRNDEIAVNDIAAMAPAYLVISPGPCSPNEAGISLDVVTAFAGRIPLLGVCLGHQCIGQAFGAQIVRAAQPMHGKTSRVFHQESGLYAGLENPLQVMRYHSLVIDPESLPETLEITAKTWGDEIMGVSHRGFASTAAPCEGVQFHPESIMTPAGKQLLGNFLASGRPVAERRVG